LAPSASRSPSVRRHEWDANAIESSLAVVDTVTKKSRRSPSTSSRLHSLLSRSSRKLCRWRRNSSSSVARSPSRPSVARDRRPRVRCRSASESRGSTSSLRHMERRTHRRTSSPSESPLNESDSGHLARTTGGKSRSHNAEQVEKLCRYRRCSGLEMGWSPTSGSRLFHLTTARHKFESIRNLSTHRLILVNYCIAPSRC
jgi:hypothetical protein